MSAVRQGFGLQLRLKHGSEVSADGIRMERAALLEFSRVTAYTVYAPAVPSRYAGSLRQSRSQFKISITDFQRHFYGLRHGKRQTRVRDTNSPWRECCQGCGRKVHRRIWSARATEKPPTRVFDPVRGANFVSDCGLNWLHLVLGGKRWQLAAAGGACARQCRHGDLLLRPGLGEGGTLP